MVFIGGPRQVGKTTLARMVGEKYDHPAYLNWDNRGHRQDILKSLWSPDADLMIFDEIHKYTKWKSLVKGIWDTRSRNEHIIVTGSSRLDIYRRGGDSLMGRYRYFRLHPFTLREWSGAEAPFQTMPEQPWQLLWDRKGHELSPLLSFGGFPEPLLSGSRRSLKRWQKERFERVFREDIRETESVRSLSQVELLGLLLPGKVGSPLSLNNLARELDVSQKTVQLWMELLSRNYYVFRIHPYHKKIQRALHKSAKCYLWDWSEVSDPGARFENMVAVHLLKFCHLLQDAHGIGADLFYVRDREKREVDFLVAWEGKPWFLVECKAGRPEGIHHLERFAGMLGVAQKYLVALDPRHDFVDRKTGVRVVPAERFLMALA